MRGRLILLAVVFALGVAVYIALRQEGADVAEAVDGAGGAIVQVSLPAELSPDAEIGKRVFEARCAACHGKNAGGVEGSGPPLVHVIYEPSHHGDASFLLAVRNGVR